MGFYEAENKNAAKRSLTFQDTSLADLFEVTWVLYEVQMHTF